jgi:hypothetical protein
VFSLERRLTYPFAGARLKVVGVWWLEDEKKSDWRDLGEVI